MIPRARPRRAGALEDDLQLAEVLSGDLDRVEERGAGDDRRAVLVVVEDRDLQCLAERLFDVKAVRRCVGGWGLRRRYVTLGSPLMLPIVFQSRLFRQRQALRLATHELDTAGGATRVTAARV